MLGYFYHNSHRFDARPRKTSSRAHSCITETQTVLHEVRTQTEETAEKRASSMADCKSWLSKAILSACDLALLLGHGENLQRVKISFYWNYSRI